MRKKLGETLVGAGLISEDDLRTALAEHKRSGERLGAVLVRMNLATERQISKAVAYQLGFPYVNLTEHPPDPSVVTLIPKDVALKRTCIALRMDKGVLTVAMADPLLFSLVQDLEFQTRSRIKQVVATAADILQAIAAAYPDDEPTTVYTSRRAREVPRPEPPPADLGPRPAVDVPHAERLPSERAPIEAPRAEPIPAPRSQVEIADSILASKEHSDPAPISDLVDLIVKNALKSGATDVHIEPSTQGVLIRHRLDGMLKDVMDLPKWVHEGMVARIKIMAGLDIAEKRLPQDGQIRVTGEDGREVDFRASTLRTLHGEKLVLRAMDMQRDVPALPDLGMSATALATVQELLRHQHGMLLVVGPARSGRSTTLGSMLLALKSPQRNIVSLEEQIEFQLDGINQTQVQERLKLTHGAALRAILRQDPDVICVSELRDEETARVAMQAARSSHLMLAALHADQAAAAVLLLSDLGVEASLTASALLGIVGQRLVRRLCETCKTPATLADDVLIALDVPPERRTSARFFSARGCDACHQTGYRGRLGLFEVMRVSESVRQRIASRAGEHALMTAAADEGMVTLRQDGVDKVVAGLTSADEMLRVLPPIGPGKARGGRKSGKPPARAANVKAFKKG